MLERLHIENLVLIRQADLRLGPGLIAITGETGAGKSLAGHAFGLLMGNKAGAEMVGPHGTEAYVEAEFGLPLDFEEEAEFETLRDLRPEDEPTLTLSRRVSQDGRSRAYAWGRAIPREVLVGVGERLLSLSGQFEQRRLAKASYQMDLLDAYAGEEQLRRRAETARAWKTLQSAIRRRDELLRDRAGHEVRVAELRRLVEETESFQEGEEEELTVERKKLLRLNDILIAAQQASESLSPEVSDGQGAADLAGQAERTLGPVRAVDPELDAIAVQLVEAEESLRDAASRLRGYLDSLEAEPGRLDVVNARLFAFTDACRRFRVQTYAELLEQRDRAQEELLSVDAGEDPLERAEGEVAEAQAVYDALAKALRKAREEAIAGAGSSAATAAGKISGTAAGGGKGKDKKASPTTRPGFEAAVQEELKSLGMGDGELKVELAEKAPGPRGRDEVTFLVKPNAGLPFAPVAQTASGGELSRIALALRVVSHTQSGEGTIVFDEIDAGVGGVTAHAVADSLRRLGERAQVIAITHLPQIASVAGTHLAVEKRPGEPTMTEVKELDEAERQAELKRMLGGVEFLSGVAGQTP